MKLHKGRRVFSTFGVELIGFRERLIYTFEVIIYLLNVNKMLLVIFHFYEEISAFPVKTSNVGFPPLIRHWSLEKYC